MPPDDSRKLQVRVSPDGHRNVKIYAAQQSLSIEQVITKGLEALGIVMPPISAPETQGSGSR